MSFKIGNWIEFYDEYEDFAPFKVEEKHIAFPTDWWECVTLWSPKEGDWVWYGYEVVQIIDGSDSKAIKMVRQASECYEEVQLDQLEPFIGTLRTFIQK